MPVEQNGRPVCGATTRAGTPCDQTILGPSGRCRMHSPGTLRGAAHHSYRHGRYTQDLPTGLVPRYRSARADPDALASRDELALVDVRLAEAVAELGKNDGAATFAAVAVTVARVQAARAKGAAGAMELAMALDALVPLAAEGAAIGARWQEVLRLVAVRTRLVESERKRLVELRQVLSLEEALLFLEHVTQLVAAHVPDRAARAAIAAGMRRLAVGRGAPALEAG